MYRIEGKRGRIEVTRTDSNIKVGLARDHGRIYSRPGAGWVDLTPEAAEELLAALETVASEARAIRLWQETAA